MGYVQYFSKASDKRNADYSMILLPVARVSEHPPKSTGQLTIVDNCWSLLITAWSFCLWQGFLNTHPSPQDSWPLLIIVDLCWLQHDFVGLSQSFCPPTKCIDRARLLNLCFGWQLGLCQESDSGKIPLLHFWSFWNCLFEPLPKDFGGLQGMQFCSENCQMPVLKR